MAGGASTPNTWSNQDNPHLDPAASLSRLHHVVGSLDKLLRLPNSARSFLIYLGGLLLIAAGAILHVLLAAQIMQDEVTLSRLQSEHTAIEQQNGDLIFRIARTSNMMRLHEQVKEAGYVQAEEREYVVLPQTAAATVPDTSGLDTAAEAADAAPDSQRETRHAGATHTGDPLRDWEALLGVNLPFTAPPSEEATSRASSPTDSASGRRPAQSPSSNTTGLESRSSASEGSSGQIPLDQTPMETWQNWLGESKAFFNRLVP